VNFVAVSDILQTPPALVAAALAADNVVIAVYFAFLFSLCRPSSEEELLAMEPRAGVGEGVCVGYASCYGHRLAHRNIDETPYAQTICQLNNQMQIKRFLRSILRRCPSQLLWASCSALYRRPWVLCSLSVRCSSCPPSQSWLQPCSPRPWAPYLLRVESLVSSQCRYCASHCTCTVKA
jgi:Protein of unknown function (DUF819)